MEENMGLSWAEIAMRGYVMKRLLGRERAVVPLSLQRP